MNNSALGVLWLPVLTSIPRTHNVSQSLDPAQLGGPLPMLSLVSAARGVRSLDSGPALGRALCSHCSCETDPGCRHNCDRCGYHCGSCSCAASLECKYNCDKCETYSSTERTEAISTTTTAPVQADITGECSGLVEADLCEWGVLCRTLVRLHFPHCDYDCSNCSVALPQCANAEDLCALGPDCQQVKDDKFPRCRFNCLEQCQLEISPVVADDVNHFLDNEWEELPGSSLPHEDNAWRPPPISPSVADNDVNHFLDNEWEELPGSSLPHEDNAWRPPPISPSVAENEGADKETSVSENEKEDSFSWLDFHPRASSCTAELGPARGQTCKFPFNYQGETYFGCAPLEGDMKILSEEFAGIGWCSTKRDINGIHVTGAYPQPLRYVGICGESCKVNGS